MTRAVMPILVCIGRTGLRSEAWRCFAKFAIVGVPIEEDNSRKGDANEYGMMGGNTIRKQLPLWIE